MKISKDTILNFPADYPSTDGGVDSMELCNIFRIYFNLQYFLYYSPFRSNIKFMDPISKTSKKFRWLPTIMNTIATVLIILFELGDFRAKISLLLAQQFPQPSLYFVVAMELLTFLLAVVLIKEIWLNKKDALGLISFLTEEYNSLPKINSKILWRIKFGAVLQFFCVAIGNGAIGMFLKYTDHDTKPFWHIMLEDSRHYLFMERMVWENDSVPSQFDVIVGCAAMPLLQLLK